MMNRLLLLCLVLSLCAMPRARAEDLSEVNREQARHLAQQAPLAFERKDYRRAQELLEEAYRLYPTAKLHYSLGRVYEAQGKAAAAAVSYQRFLDQVPPEERQPSQTEEVTASLRRLGRRLGRVQVRGPAGAWFQLDAGERMILPATDLWVEPGAHHVSCAGGELEVDVQVAGTATVYLLSTVKEPPPPPLHPVVGSTRPLRVLKWVTLAVGVAAAATGAALIAVDGRQRCDLSSRQIQCAELLQSRDLGIGLVSVGGAALIGAGVMFGLDARAGRGVQSAMATVGGTF